MVYHRSEGNTTPSTRDRVPPTSQSQPEAQPQNAFRNDGSFLEMFKRMQEANASGASGASSSNKTSPPAPAPATVSSRPETSQSMLSEEMNPGPPTSSGNASSGDESSKDAVKRAPLVGKRRGGRVLPTGVVKKKRADGEEGSEEKPKDAWSLYMAEVKRYKETSCEEDGKTRPLVK